MVQILPRLPSSIERFAEAFSPAAEGMGAILGKSMQQQRLQQEQQLQQQQQAQALQKLGLDPSLLNLPQSAQSAYFKSKFVPEKPLTSLQQAQEELARAKIGQVNSRAELFQRLSGSKQPDENSFLQEGSRDLPRNANQGTNALGNIPKRDLMQLAAFAGQPGEEGIIGNIAKFELDRQEKEEKLKIEEEERDYKRSKETPEYIRDKILTEQQATADLKFYNDHQEKRSKQILKKESLNRLEKIGKKDVTGKAYESFLEKMGLISLTSTGRREYSAEAKNQFTDFKQIVGSQMSSGEFFTLTNAYPNADFSPEANQAIIDNLKQVHDTLDKENEIIQKLKEENNGKIPEFFQEKVNKKLKKYTEEKLDKIKENTKKIYGIPEGYSLMFDPEGNPLSVPDEEIVKYLVLGASF